MIKHKHHIIPRHAGGTDEPSNLFECSVKEHAELHLALYLEHGRWQDWIAFQMLSGQIDNAEAIRQAQVMGQLGRKHSPETLEKLGKHRVGVPHTEEVRKQISETLTGKPKTEEHRRNISEGRKKLEVINSPETRKKMSEAKKGTTRSEETKRKISETMKRIRAQQKDK